jgi:hypothetical protein
MDRLTLTAVDWSLTQDGGTYFTTVESWTATEDPHLTTTTKVGTLVSIHSSHCGHDAEVTCFAAMHDDAYGLHRDGAHGRCNLY